MYLILALVFAIGVLTKLADLIADDGLNIRDVFSYTVGGVYGILAAYVLVAEPLLAPVILATVIAVIVMKKIDSEPHVIGIASMLFFLGLWGLPVVNALIMSIFIVAGVLDEIGNDMSDKGKIRGRLKHAFSYMMISDVTALLVSAMTGAWIIFLGMIFFDAGYLLTSAAGERTHQDKGYKKRR